MPYLISDISDDTELLPVNAALSNPTYPLFYDLASETVKVLAGANTTEWQVARGVGNTQAVRHSRGTPLVLNANPYSGGGEGVTVTTLAGPDVTGVDTIQVPNVVDAGGGRVVLATLVISDSDPGAIGPGNFWLNNDAAPQTAITAAQLAVRNVTDDGWYVVSPVIDTASSSDEWLLLDNADQAEVGATNLSARLIGWSAPDGGGDRARVVAADFGVEISVQGTQVIYLLGLPTADPLLAGQLYSDGVPSAGNPKTLKISGG